MAQLAGSDKRKLEKLFGMNTGYVLNFSDRTFRIFFDDYGIDIDTPIYRTNGTSKANRMRTFWDTDSSYVIGRIVEALITYAIEENVLPDDSVLVADWRKIAQDLLINQPVAEIGALTVATDERDFEVMAEQIRHAIEKNQPEVALDRLHTFVIKFIRVTCNAHGIEVDRDKPLHSIFGEYVKALRDGSFLESHMTERILKTSISVLEAFNDVRNNKSLAHDNPILNYEESLLIFNHVASSVRFIKALELKINSKKVKLLVELDDDFPF